MATGTQGTTARYSERQAPLSFRVGITYADNGRTIKIGTLPAGALVHKTMSGVHVITAFDGNSTNVLDVGYTSDSGTNNLGTQLSLASTGFVALDEDTDDYLVAADTELSMLVTSTANATAGAAEVVIVFFPDNDR